MSRIFSRHRASEGSRRTLRPGLVPVSLEHSPHGPATISFSDGSRSQPSCLRCPTPACMQYADSEVRSASMPDFPADRNLSVCPSSALSRAADGVPRVDSDSCVLCGACATRCPVGAIRMSPWPVVDDSHQPAFVDTSDSDSVEMTIRIFHGVLRLGALLDESDYVVDTLRERLFAARNSCGDQFPNILARNLLLSSGVGAAMSRTGDNAARMDIALGPPWPAAGCAEVEFGDVAILDAPRDILDDVAVSVGRHKFDKRLLVTLVISDVLPNWRSEYWRMVQDIRSIVDVRIGTVTVFALMLLVWRKRLMAELPATLFHVDVETTSYREAVLEPILGRSLSITPGARPIVDVAK